MSASYNGITAWIWKKVSRFDYDKYWKMREYVTSHQGGIKAYYYLYKIKKWMHSIMRLWERILYSILQSLRNAHIFPTD